MDLKNSGAERLRLRFNRGPEGLHGQISKFANYAQILKNSVASKETASNGVFLMKDPAAVEMVVGLGGAGGGMDCRLLIMLLL